MVYSWFILLYKGVSFFCLKLRISITTELIGFSISGKLHIGPEMVLGYLIFRCKASDGFKLFFLPIYVSSITDSIDARGIASSLEKSKIKRFIL